MLVYEIDGSVRYINVPSTLDIPNCKLPVQPIVPKLKEDFGQVDIMSQMDANQNLNCNEVNKNLFKNYISSRINNKNKVYSNQLMMNNSFQPWSQSSFYLLDDDHPYNSYLEGYDHFYNVNVDNKVAIKYDSEKDLNSIINHMCSNQNKENWRSNSNWQLSMSPDDINY